MTLKKNLDGTIELIHAFGCVPSATKGKPVFASVLPSKQCDLCHGPLKHYPTFYDGATGMGPWAWMCKACFEEYGIGLGTGRGQEYNSVNNQKVRG